MNAKSATAMDKVIGSKLKELRILNGLTTKEVGNALGVTLQQIQKYENGINRISASRLYDYAELVGTPISYFFGGEVVNNSGNKRFMVGIVSDMNDLSDDIKVSIGSLIRALKDDK